MNEPTCQPLTVAPLKRLGMYASVLFVAFLLGFVPMWLTARTRANERDAAQHALLFTHAENDAWIGGHLCSTR